jgi:hypothetical protein
MSEMGLELAGSSKMPGPVCAMSLMGSRHDKSKAYLVVMR